MKFILTWLLSVVLFFIMFCTLGAGVIAAISFIFWELPNLVDLQTMALVVARVAFVAAIPFGLAFTFSDEGRKAWKV